MLPHADLKPYYSKVTWLFVTRNFDLDAKDREALRTHDRFGISSWPQLVLFDPRDDRVLEDMSRQLEPFKKQLDRHLEAVPGPNDAGRAKLARLGAAREALERGEREQSLRALRELAAEEDPLDIWLEARELLRGLQQEGEQDARTVAARLRDPDVRERAIAVELAAQSDKADAFVPFVEERLVDPAEHLIVKIRAVEFLAPRRGGAIAKAAGPLLRVPSDPLRYKVLDVLAAHPNPELAGLLAELHAGVGKTIPSRNPNVLRSRVAKALVGSGDAQAIPALESFLTSVLPNNGTMGASLQALAGIASRATAEERARIVEVLLASFPGPLGDERYAAFKADWMQRRLPQLAQTVRATLAEVTGKDDLPAVPPNWSAEERAAYLERLRAAL